MGLDYWCKQSCHTLLGFSTLRQLMPHALQMGVLCCWQLTQVALHLQERWLQGDTCLKGLLKALPIFEAANAVEAQEPAFKDLHELTLAAPERMPAAAMEDTFIAASMPGQRAALSCLGVEMLSHSTVIRCACTSSLPLLCRMLRCVLHAASPLDSHLVQVAKDSAAGKGQ